MTLQEFQSKYNFHDSFFESMKYDEHNAELVLIINFAFWMQKDFPDGNEENGLLKVTFHNVTDYKCKGGDPSGNFVGILNTASDGDTFIFNMFDDESGDFIELSIKSPDVSAEKL